ncbi:hypothetical protein BpHYR1_041120 [Brachionus plicatilis]|uniref:Uncharacterized protein n=1 Tax=Brachionus plicatilis TaxID=10195 RepID=A0A3M7S3S1_BRAPC|nr:hypothetical protein BpHYR1_041120 [Brachionus plicatilis]
MFSVTLTRPNYSENPFHLSKYSTLPKRILFSTILSTKNSPLALSIVWLFLSTSSYILLGACFRLKDSLNFN